MEPTSVRIVEDIQGLPRVLHKIIDPDRCSVSNEFLLTGKRARSDVNLED
jgi:hypothetical protein